MTSRLSEILGFKVEHILCISLEERYDRREKILAQAERYGLRIEFVIVKKHQIPHVGCMESHLKCIALAKERGYEYVCIFEDDAVLIHNRMNQEPINVPEDWNMIFLGYNALRGYRYSEHLLKLIMTLAAHSYLIHSRVYDEVLEGIKTSWWEIPEMQDIAQLEWNLSHSRDVIDVFYGKYICHRLGSCYGIYPMLTNQGTGYSDIVNQYTDYTSWFEKSANVLSLVHSPVTSHQEK